MGNMTGRADQNEESSTPYSKYLAHRNKTPKPNNKDKN